MDQKSENGLENIVRRQSWESEIINILLASIVKTDCNEEIIAYNLTVNEEMNGYNLFKEIPSLGIKKNSMWNWRTLNHQ